EKLQAVKDRLNFEDTSRHSELGTLSKRRGLKERLGPRYALSISGVGNKMLQDIPTASYDDPTGSTLCHCKGPASESSAKKKRMTVVITTEDMQKRRNDVKARTTLLLALPDEHQLRFSKLQAIVSHLEFMDVEIEQDDLNQKFLTSLTPEWIITDVAAASLSHDTVCAYIATQSNGSQIKYEEITQIDEDDIEEMDIK
nr:hypothetical protein [Tanacetum cinerariifolium]